MSRQEFSKKTKLAAWQRCGGKCECGCGKKIIAGVEYDHMIEAAIGGYNSLENCRVMSAKCHAAKTSDRRPEIDKTRRGFEKRIGARKSSKPMPFGRKSKWKKKMDGSIIPRETREGGTQVMVIDRTDLVAELLSTADAYTYGLNGDISVFDRAAAEITRLRSELSARDKRIEELEGALASLFLGAEADLSVNTNPRPHRVYAVEKARAVLSQSKGDET